MQPAPLVLVAAAVVVASCNPCTKTGRLPPARCQVDGDCNDGETCVQGVCTRAGWVSGRLHFTVPSRGDPGRLRLVVAGGDFTATGILARRPPRFDDVIAEVPGTHRFRIDGLPRGQLTLFALCRDDGSVAGMVPFLVDEDRRGHRPGFGFARDNEVDLTVDLACCRD